jgi:hypothetical protein
MTQLSELLENINACELAVIWAGDKTIDEVVDTCHRGDWMLWLAKKLDIDLPLLTLAKGHCVATVLHLMKDERSKEAVQAAIDFGEGKITKEELKTAAAAAYTVAYAAAYADAAAYAAAYAADAADAADAARKANQMQTAGICRKYIGEEIKKLVNERLNPKPPHEK